MRTLTVVGLTSLTGVLISLAIKRTQATKTLREAGFEAGGPNIPRQLRSNWRGLFQARTWQWSDRVRLMGSDVRSLDAVGTALRDFKPRGVLLGFCGRLENVEALRALPKLERLDFYECPNVQGLEIVGEFKHLRELTFADTRSLRSLSIVQAGPSLESLHITNCSGLEDVEALREFKRLRSLFLTGSKVLKDTEILRGLTALEELDLSGSSELADISALHGLPALQKVGLRGCPKLTPEAVGALRSALPKAQISFP